MAAAQPIEVTLVPEVFGCCELRVHALRLKYHSDVLSRRIRILGDIGAADECMAGAGQHKSGEHAK
jgi:hypothetical protein